jgi:hypothetical protein
MTIRFPVIVLMLVAILFLVSGKIVAGDPLEGVWYLHVDRALAHQSAIPNYPWMSIGEGSYYSVSDGPTYKVVISGSLGKYRITISDPLLRGRQKPTDALEQPKDPLGIVFLLDVGAGGRFIIMHVNDRLEGELTFYGSGRPITRSERGVLTR